MANRRQDVYTVHSNEGLMSYPQERAMHLMHGHHGDRPESNDPKVFQGQNCAPDYDASPMTSNQSIMSPGGLMSHPQQLAMNPQDNNSNVFQGQNCAPPYDGLNMSHPITSQPDASVGQIAPSGQWIHVTTECEPTTPSDENLNPQSKQWVIFKRTISVVFMVADIVMAWIQVFEMDKAGGNIVFGQKKLELNCPKSQSAIVIYIVVMCVSTLYTTAQIINVIGETIHDVTGGAHGYQFVHGFNEVIIKLSIKDIPQFLLMVIAMHNSCECTRSTDRWLKLIGSYFAAKLSSCVRTGTCKQEDKLYKCNNECSCCCCCCCGNCCPEESGYMCFCCYLPICSQKYPQCVPVSICKYMGCCENGIGKCDCTPSKEDPKISLKILEDLYYYQYILMIANTVLMLLKCELKWL